MAFKTMAFKPQHEFIELLCRHEVPFCLVGGLAVQIHGFSRETDDIDFVWLRSTESAALLLDALREANACWISNERDPATGIERLVPVSSAYINCGNHKGVRCTSAVSEPDPLGLSKALPSIATCFNAP